MNEMVVSSTLTAPLFYLKINKWIHNFVLLLPKPIPFTAGQGFLKKKNPSPAPHAGYEKYNSMRADPALCFLERVGMPDAKAIAAEQRGTDMLADGGDG